MYFCYDEEVRNIERLISKTIDRLLTRPILRRVVGLSEESVDHLEQHADQSLQERPIKVDKAVLQYFKGQQEQQGQQTE